MVKESNPQTNETIRTRVISSDLAPITAQTARDAMKDTPVMANQMLSVGRTIWGLGYSPRPRQKQSLRQGEGF
jgi:hypothetical protein